MAIAFRTNLSDTGFNLKGSEFLKKVKALGDRRNIKTSLVPHRGKGSHQTLYFGDNFTIIRSPKDELKKGTLHGMLKQLGIDPTELQ
jgi:mRNA interferase HicA